MTINPAVSAVDLWRQGTSGQLEDLGSRGRTSVFVGDDVVLKVFLAETDKPDREIAGLEAAVSSGLRIPQLLWHGEVDDKRSVLVERLAGTQPEPATDEQWRLLTEATGAIARQLQVPVPAFGAWTIAPSDSAAELIVRRTSHNAAAVRDQQAIDPSVVDLLHEWVLRQVQRLDHPRPPVLVHRDLSDRNVFGTWNGAAWDLTAVIDFESCGGGLPEEEARWPALLERGGIRPQGTLAAFQEGLGTSLQHDVLDIFVVDAAIDIMSYAGHRNPALMDAALTAAQATTA